MSLHDPVRLLLDLPAPGDWNMAVDELLLEAALREQVATVRLYQWSEATLSLGYFQKRAEVAPPWDQLPMVRRLSGGGAILHHHELTYSIALPAEHVRAADPSTLYAAVHETIILRLARRGASLALRGVAQRERDSAFLCFARGDPNDVVIGEHKVLGSAQRRRRGAVLQHGSLVLATSPHAPEVVGLAELTGREWDVEELGRELLLDLGQLFGETVGKESLSPDETSRVRELAPQYRA